MGFFFVLSTTCSGNLLLARDSYSKILAYFCGGYKEENGNLNDFINWVPLQLKLNCHCKPQVIKKKKVKKKSM